MIKDTDDNFVARYVRVLDTDGINLGKSLFKDALLYNACISGLYNNWEIIDRNIKFKKNKSVVEIIIGRRLCLFCKKPLRSDFVIPYCGSCLKLKRQQWFEEQEEK